MSEKIRNLDDIVKELKKDLDYYETYLSCLEKVEIKTKKDGSFFKNINQNFVNAKIINPDYLGAFHPVFRVWGQTKMQGYLDFSFDCYLYADTLPDGDPRREKAQKGSSWSRETYCFTVQEIIERLEKEKEFAKEKIKNYQSQIEETAEIFNLVNEKVNDLKSCIYENCKKFREQSLFRSSIEYALADYVRNTI